VFQASLGIADADAEFLRQALIQAAAVEEVRVGQSDKHGTRYTLDCEVRRGAKSALVRSHWIVQTDDDVPRLITCYIA